MNVTSKAYPHYTSRMFDVPAFVPVLAFVVPLGAIGAIFALGGTALVRPDFDFFPPPSKESWQHKAFMSLFRLFVYPLLALSVIAFDPSRASLTSPTFIAACFLPSWLWPSVLDHGPNGLAQRIR